jgi:hypothetical protein
MEIEDGIIFQDEKTGKEITFNYKTFYEMVVACIEKYGRKTSQEAREIVNNSFIVKDPPTNLIKVRKLVHEYEYHWAMILLYGEGYWERIPGSYPPNEEYFQWSETYQKENNLAEDLFEE